MWSLPVTAMPGHTHHVCPNCGTELCGGHIWADWSLTHAVDSSPEARRAYAECYGASPEHDRCGGQEIGIEHQGGYDGVSEWLMPCCRARYDRWTGERLDTICAAAAGAGAEARPAPSS